MTFKEFLESCRQYKEFVIIEEKGNKEEIEGISRQHGKKQKGMFFCTTEKRNF